MSMSMTDPAATSWHWDKRIPVALILAIVVQSGGAIWWAAGISARVSDLEKDRASSGDQLGRVIKLETQINSIDKTLDRLEGKLDKVLDQPKDKGNN